MSERGASLTCLPVPFLRPYKREGAARFRRALWQIYKHVYMALNYLFNYDDSRTGRPVLFSVLSHLLR